MNKEQLQQWCLEKSTMIANRNDPLFLMLGKALLGIDHLKDPKAVEYALNLHELHIALAKIEGAKQMIPANALAELRGCKPGTVRNACIRGDVQGAVNPSGRLWLVPADTSWEPKTPGGQKKQK